MMAERAELFLVIGAEDLLQFQTSGRSGPNAPAHKTPGWWPAPKMSTGPGSMGVETLGLTAGASAPEDLVQGLIAACRARFDITVKEVTTATESVVFKLPRVLERS